MSTLLTVLHTLTAVLLVVVVLLQSGRGGGLTEGFAAAESMFGAQTSSFLIKGTTIMSIIFLITSLSLAVVSSKQGSSLMSNKISSGDKAVEEVLPTQAAVDEVTEEMQQTLPEAQEVQAPQL